MNKIDLLQKKANKKYKSKRKIAKKSPWKWVPVLDVTWGQVKNKKGCQ